MRAGRAFVWIACLIAVPAAGEILARKNIIQSPSTVVQHHHLRMVGDVPVWLGDDFERRENRACATEHPERTRILIVGASVSYGDDVEADATFAYLLEQRLNKARPVPGFCVLNYASPGFTHEQELVVAREELPEYRPDVVFFQDSDAEWLGSRYRQYGDIVYDVGQLHAGADGFPGFAFVPAALNRFLFVHSRLYADLVLARGPRIRFDEVDRGPDDRRKAAEELLRLARAVGARPIFLMASDLPQSVPVGVGAENARVEKPLVELGQAEGVPVIALGELAGPSDMSTRIDFRHFNERGHQLIAQRLDDVVLHLPDRASSPRPDVPRLGSTGRN